MTSRWFVWGLAAGVAITAAPLGAQEVQPVAGGQVRIIQSGDKVVAERAQVPLVASGTRVPMERSLIKGAPYSAEVVTESVQILPDGNRIVRKSTGRVYRDSQGRTRREDDQAGRQPRVSVSDPVGGIAFSLDPEPKIAWRTPMKTAGAITAMVMPPPPPPSPTPADPADLQRRAAVEQEVVQAARAGGGGRGGAVLAPSVRGPAWEERKETLAARNIEGVMAEGTRTTRTIPAGAIGNEQPIVTVTEEWRSPELQVLVMTRTSDPRTGESTYRLLNITRAEPNQSWFEIPADYTVRDSGVGRSMVRVPR